jgi:hypothetical protein
VIFCPLVVLARTKPLAAAAITLAALTILLLDVMLPSALIPAVVCIVALKLA